MLEVDLSASSSKPVARLLQHAILQLCNEHVGYCNKLQILGVLCLTVDEEQQEIVVKVNNTLKRVNPPPSVTSVLPNDNGLNYGYIANGVLPQSIGNKVAAQDSTLSTLCVQDVISLATNVRPLFVCENQSNGVAQENGGRSDSPDVIVVDKDNESTKDTQSSAKRTGGRRKTTPTKAQNFDDNTNPLCDEDVTTILPVDPDEASHVAAKQIDSYISHTPVKGKSFTENTQKSRDTNKTATKRRSKTPQRDGGGQARNSLSPSGSFGVLNNMATIRALLAADSSSSFSTTADSTQTRDFGGLGQLAVGNSQAYVTQNLIVPSCDGQQMSFGLANSSSLPTLLDTAQLGLQPVITIDLSNTMAVNPSSPSFKSTPGNTAASSESNVPIMVAEIKEEMKECGMTDNDDAEMQTAEIRPAASDEDDEGVLQIVGVTSERHKRQQGDIISGIANRLALESMKSGRSSSRKSRLNEDGPSSAAQNSPSTSGFTPKKVKDIIMFNDNATIFTNKGGLRFEADTADFMMDQLGSTETRRRRRRGPYTECLTLEEIAEYMGPRDPGVISFQCRYCSESTTNLAKYLQHTFSAHSAYICHECGKHFTTKSSLLRHRPIHTGMRRFICSFCKKTFYRKDKCKAHIKRHLGTQENILEFDDHAKLEETIEQSLL